MKNYKKYWIFIYREKFPLVQLRYVADFWGLGVKNSSSFEKDQKQDVSIFFAFIFLSLLFP